MLVFGTKRVKIVYYTHFDSLFRGPADALQLFEIRTILIKILVFLYQYFYIKIQDQFFWSSYYFVIRGHFFISV